MAVTEGLRHDLYLRLEQQLGPREAETMMELLPTAGWSDVARRRDLDILERSINERITSEGALQRVEMAELRTELKTEMAELRTELKTEIASLRVEFTSAFAGFRDDLHRDQRTMQRQIILALIVALVSIVLSTIGLR